MTNERIPLLIDTDPGVDDALALLMAFNDPRHEVVGLTIAAGNVGLDHTVANALKLCEVCGVDVPVFAGTAEPLLHPAEDAAFVHGRDGFGDTGYAPAARTAEAEHAALAILRLSHEHAGRLLLVALGPLTNVALALKLDPTLPQRVARCVVMGGAVSAHGNITAAAEFNIAFDPESAHIVFSAFPRIDVADWEAVIAHGFLHTEAERWLAADSPRARFYDSISAHTRAWSRAGRGERWHAADALAMAFALEPDGALEVLERPLAVELEGRHSRGATIVDWNRQSGRADNAAILMRYDQARFEGLLQQALAAGSPGQGGQGRPTELAGGRTCVRKPRFPIMRGSVPFQPRFKPMKAGIHPEYRDVVFQDVTSDFKILTRSTLASKETVKWEDGNEYPLVKIEVSSSSHPFYTGQNKLIDTSGRVDKFRKRYQK